MEELLASFHVATLCCANNVANNTLCCVTALYDIQREGTDGRTMDQYIEWLEKTCYLDHPMVIFLDRKLYHIHDTILRIRDGLVTHIVVTCLDEIPCYWLYEPVKRIHSIRTDCKYPNDITNKNPLYVCIQYSKFEWMRMASDYVTTSRYAWIDAGISRFFPHISKGSKLNIPIPTDRDALITQFNMRLLEAERHPELLLPDNIIGTNECFIKGTILVSTRCGIDRIHTEVVKILNYMIDHDIIDNEQIALAIIWQQHRDWFDWIPADHHHLNMSLCS